MKNVLIVEDEMIIALTIEQMIKNMGHNVAAKVASGKQAVQQAFQLQPDIILMDIRLKGKMDGIEAMEQIQTEANIPVIYVTGNNDAMYIERIKGTDYIDFIVKPITQHQLLQSFKKAS